MRFFILKNYLDISFGKCKRQKKKKKKRESTEMRLGGFLA